MKTVHIWDKEIGEGNLPYFIAELGTCHRGSVEVAKENAKAAVAAGADCVKTETFYETEVADDAARKVFTTRTKKYSVPLKEHMRRYQFTLDQHHEIKKYCDELGVPFMATAHSWEAVDFLKDIGAAAIKVASPDIVHIPLIRYVAKTGLVIFLDTGGAYQYEVELAVKTARDAGCNDLIVNHNPSGHPAPAEKHDLRIIPRFKEILGIPVGFADHYDGYEMMPLAVALGANCIEKPISEDRFLEECEHIWAISRKDLKEAIGSIHDAYKAMGNKERPMGLTDRPENLGRVALIASKDLQSGGKINLDNITFGKPRLGLGVENWNLVEGRKLVRNKKKGSYIQWDDI